MNSTQNTPGDGQNVTVTFLPRDIVSVYLSDTLGYYIQTAKDVKFHPRL